MRFTDEFNQDAVAQVVALKDPISEVARSQGINTKSLSTWTAHFEKSPSGR
ncbi:MAG: transposase [Yoonia sp.]